MSLELIVPPFMEAGFTIPETLKMVVTPLKENVFVPFTLKLPFARRSCTVAAIDMAIFPLCCKFVVLFLVACLLAFI